MANVFQFCASLSGTTQHTLSPQTTAAGGVGITNAVLPIVLKQFTVTAVNTGGEIKVIKLPAEGFVFLTVPNIR
jgi:hypothetical protein